MIVIATGRGIVTKVSSYYEYEKKYYDIWINHSNGFESVFMGLSETTLEYGSFILKGHEIGNIGYNNGTRNKGLQYQLWYLGRIINPEIIIFDFNQDNFLSENLQHLTEDIVDFDFMSTRKLNENIYITYESKIINIRKPDLYFQEIFGEPENTIIEKFEDRDKSEYDKIIKEYGEISTIRYAFDENIYAIKIFDSKIKLMNGLSIGSAMYEVYEKWGSPYSIHFNGINPSERVKNYILKTDNENKKNIYGFDYFNLIDTLGRYDLFIDFKEEKIDAIMVSFDYDS